MPEIVTAENGQQSFREMVQPTSAVYRRLVRDLRSQMLHRWPTYYPHHASSDLAKMSLDLRECGYSVILKARLEFPRQNAHERLVVKIRREQKYGSILFDDVTE